MINTSPTTVIQLQAALGVDHWRKLFNLADLTLLPGSFERVRAALQHPSSNADSVANAMKGDPALCLHFFMRANRLVERAGNELHSLPHMISLLGFNNVGQILKSLPVAERPLPFYWQQLQASLLRHDLLMRLPLHNLGIDPTQLAFSVLFSDCELWLRWHFAAREQMNFNGLARNPKIGRAKAKLLVYGSDIDTQLRTALQSQSLPHDLKDSLKQSPQSLKRLMKELLNGRRGKAFTAPLHKRQCLIFLLDRLVANFCAAPEHRSTRRYQALVAQLLQVAETSVSQCLHQAAGELTPLHPSLIDTHPARRLLCFWPRDLGEPIYALPSPQKPQVQRSIEKPTEANADQKNTPTNTGLQKQQSPSTNSQSGSSNQTSSNNQSSLGKNATQQSSSTNRLLDNRFLDANLVRQILQALSKGHADFTSLNSILQALSQAFEKGMGMSFGAILVPTPDGSWNTKFQFDDQGLPEIERLPAAGLLTKIGAKSTVILINKDNRAAIIEQLPSNLMAKLDQRELLMISLFLHTKLVAVLLAAEVDLAPPRVQTCKRLAQATQQAIARLAVQVKRQSARH